MRAARTPALALPRLRPCPRSSPFVCTHCQPLLRSPSSSRNGAIRAASSDNKPSKENLPFSERLRRRMWGTDNPPGQKDPYSPATPEDRRRLQEEESRLLAEEEAQESKQGRKSWLRRQEQAPEAEANPARVEEASEEPATVIAQHLGGRGKQEMEALGNEELENLGYVPAQTWDGLPRRGGKYTKKMIADRVLEERPFDPFLDANKTGPFSASQLVQTELLHLLEEQGAIESTDAPAEGAAVAALDSEKWEQYDISDPKTKFALVHRITHASGQRLSDPAIARFRTAGDIVRYLSKPPKPPTIAEQLLAMPQLQALPNVEIHARRRGRYAQDVEYGRAKVIREELARRGLLDDKTHDGGLAGNLTQVPARNQAI